MKIRCVWVVEQEFEYGWGPVYSCCTRTEARRYQKEELGMWNDYGEKYRIRKYVPE